MLGLIHPTNYLDNSPRVNVILSGSVSSDQILQIHKNEKVFVTLQWAFNNFLNVILNQPAFLSVEIGSPKQVEVQMDAIFLFCASDDTICQALGGAQLPRRYK